MPGNLLRIPPDKNLRDESVISGNSRYFMRYSWFIFPTSGIRKRLGILIFNPQHFTGFNLPRPRPVKARFVFLAWVYIGYTWGSALFLAVSTLQYYEGGATVIILARNDRIGFWQRQGFKETRRWVFYPAVLLVAARFNHGIVNFHIYLIIHFHGEI